ncbi:MAG TPA: HPr family phosphocarrier protein [Mucilaginibacter sp.]|jgi:phosphocarrier protein HPr|nr:HPr family phosphocarrier protein [Mucilaginibacter sp.]
MITKDYIIMAPQGLHARPATTLIRLVKNFKSIVNIQKGAKITRLNSMINLLSMTIKGGDTIKLIIDGEDETNAAEALDQFFAEELKDL